MIFTTNLSHDEIRSLSAIELKQKFNNDKILQKFFKTTKFEDAKDVETFIYCLIHTPEKIIEVIQQNITNKNNDQELLNIFTLYCSEDKQKPLQAIFNYYQNNQSKYTFFLFASLHYFNLISFFLSSYDISKNFSEFIFSKEYLFSTIKLNEITLHPNFLLTLLEKKPKNFLDITIIQLFSFFENTNNLNIFIQNKISANFLKSNSKRENINFDLIRFKYNQKIIDKNNLIKIYNNIEKTEYIMNIFHNYVTNHQLERFFLENIDFHTNISHLLDKFIPNEQEIFLSSQINKLSMKNIKLLSSFFLTYEMSTLFKIKFLQKCFYILFKDFPSNQIHNAANFIITIPDYIWLIVTNLLNDKKFGANSFANTISINSDKFFDKHLNEYTSNNIEEKINSYYYENMIVGRYLQESIINDYEKCYNINNDKTLLNNNLAIQIGGSLDQKLNADIFKSGYLLEFKKDISSFKTEISDKNLIYSINYAHIFLTQLFISHKDSKNVSKELLNLIALEFNQFFCKKYSNMNYKSLYCNLKINQINKIIDIQSILNTNRHYIITGMINNQNNCTYLHYNYFDYFLHHHSFKEETILCAETSYSLLHSYFSNNIDPKSSLFDYLAEISLLGYLGNINNNTLVSGVDGINILKLVEIFTNDDSSISRSLEKERLYKGKDYDYDYDLSL